MDTEPIAGTTVVRVAVGSAVPAAADVATAVQAAATTVRTATVGPTGVTGLEPLVTATLDGRTAFYANCTPDDGRRVVTRLDEGELADGALAVVDHDPDAAAMPTPEETALAVGRRRLLAGCGWVRPASVADVDREEFACEADARRAVAGTGFVGRGRGDASDDRPVAGTWETAREADGDPVVVVAGHDADPTAAMDRVLLESVPLAVLDGALAVAAAVEATDVVVTVGETDDLARERVRAARDALAGRVDRAAEVEVVAAPDQYRATEPTMALEAMEGADRIEARRRPPGPAAYGLYGRPTVVHTPRTCAHVREATLRPAHLDAEAADPGTRLVTVGGAVDAPATVELPTDAPLSRALDAVTHDDWRFASVGGRLGGLTRDLDVPAGAPALRGADLGTAGVVELFAPDACAVATAGRRARFAGEENCGRCVPCREGSTQLTELLRDVYDGEFAAGTLRELTRVMGETSLCQFGVAAARPARTAMDEFEAEFRAHADGRCPTGACEEGDL